MVASYWYSKGRLVIQKVFQGFLHWSLSKHWISRDSHFRRSRFVCQVSILTKFQLSGIKHSLTSFHLTGKVPVQLAPPVRGTLSVPYARVTKVVMKMNHAVVSTLKAMNFILWSWLRGRGSILTPVFRLALLATISWRLNKIDKNWHTHKIPGSKTSICK